MSQSKNLSLDDLPSHETLSALDYDIINHTEPDDEMLDAIESELSGSDTDDWIEPDFF